MPHGQAELASQPLRLSGRSSRGLQERLSLRFPRVTVAITRALVRLPPSSSLRRFFVGRTVGLYLEAANRRDLEVAFSIYSPDIVMTPPEALQVVGMAPTR